MSGTREFEQGLPESLEMRVVQALAGNDSMRSDALAELCAAHPQHAEAIRQMADDHAKARAALHARTLVPGATDLPGDVPPAIDGFRIVDVLGEGGMGTVYLAEQVHPVQRRVALKVIKLGMDSQAVLRRFDAERQALAMMNHDAIAKVFDAGTTERGQSYFVMEHVPGVPVTEYCDRHRSSLEHRIRLLQDVCRGVQHAHQKGVIHRDLKPSNVLVAEDQGRAVPKIIDFGLARATDQSQVQASILTEQGHIVGTPEYMAPEQAGLDSEDIDTRVDIYALGVILYELLIGELPFPRRHAQPGGILELLRCIREVEPPRPSARLAAAGGDTRYLAEARGTTAAGLLQALRTDLDWVTLKALDKDRNLRYASAAELADDLERFLANEPLLAGPPGTIYRLRKLLRRYRIQFTAVAAVLVVLVAGVIGTTIGLVDATRTAAKLRERTNEFDLLANVERLRVAREEAARLPILSWPQTLPALRRWRDGSWASVRDALPAVERMLAELERRAVPMPDLTPELDDATRTHLAQLEARLRTERHAAAVRRGERTPGDVALPEAYARASASALNQFAWLRVSPNEKERTFGSEALALACAREALRRIDAGDRSIGRSWVLDTLAWAAFANGLDDEALTHSRASVEAAPPEEKPEYAGYLASLQQRIAKAAGPGGARGLVELEQQITALAARTPKRLPDQASQVLHDALAGFARDVDGFQRGLAASVDKRIAWAAQIAELTLRHPDAPATWDDAIAAIAAANGRSASESYRREPPIDLSPQTGLVPIGMNPVTRLWEFYHLRSAASPGSGPDPSSLRIPRHRPDGAIEVGDGTGIVFVLLPGGRFAMGSQSEAPGGSNPDPDASPYETPVHEVDLAPFFVARHELTQGQWQRLTERAPPSYYKPGQSQIPVTWAHPVEQLTWFEARDAFAVDGLELPTEAQWEYACRAGSSAPFTDGLELEAIRRLANFADLAAERAFPGHWKHDDVEDGHPVHAPVGSYPPNAFGLYDVHGNVYEWCRDAWGLYTEPPRPGDGLRYDDPSPNLAVQRGGSFKELGVLARSAARRTADPNARYLHLGARPARRVLAPGEGLDR